MDENKLLDEATGGDPPCWSHLLEDDVDESGLGEQTGQRVVAGANLLAIAGSAGAHGPAWTVQSDDLNANLLVFGAGEGVAEHRNTEVDVLIIGVTGDATVTINGQQHALAAGRALLVPKGARRGVEAGVSGVSYLTCHRRRPGLWPTVRAPGSS